MLRSVRIRPTSRLGRQQCGISTKQYRWTKLDAWTYARKRCDEGGPTSKTIALASCVAHVSRDYIQQDTSTLRSLHVRQQISLMLLHNERAVQHPDGSRPSRTDC